MANSLDALKMAVEFEKLANVKFQEAIDNAIHEETKESLNKIMNEKSQHIDSLHWLIMAEAGKLEKTEEGGEAEGVQQENGATRLAQGKCPFDFSKMGFSFPQEKPHS